MKYRLKSILSIKGLLKPYFEAFNECYCKKNDIIIKLTKILSIMGKNKAKKITVGVGREWKASDILFMEFLNYNLNICLNSNQFKTNLNSEGETRNQDKSI